MNAHLPAVPLTVISTTNVNTAAQIVLGIKGDADYLKITNPKPSGQFYWIVIFDRSSLQVIENFMFSDHKNIPARVRSFLGNSDYFYVLTTQQLSSNKIPGGALQKWLIGKGAKLKILESHMANQTENNNGHFSLTVIDVFGNSLSTLEFHNSASSTLSTKINLKPIKIDGKSLYTPVVE